MTGEHDDVPTALGPTRGGRGIPALDRQEEPPAGPGLIDLDSPLIGSPQGQIVMCACTDFEDDDESDDAFEAWSIWRGSDLVVSNLRNPPRFILHELSRID
jgi:hypothetical protein